MIRYTVSSSCSHVSFEDQVNNYVKMGWACLGGVCVVHHKNFFGQHWNVYYQAMVRKETSYVEE
jgi:hypothetical protein